MPEPGSAVACARPGRWLCRADQLVDKGRAVLFDVLQYRVPARAFALRFEGRVVAYLNRCAHVPTEMDWQPGEFLDAERAFIVCALHGATYEPLSGHCVAGPACPRGRLTSIRVEERDGHVYWYPSRDIQPAPPSPADPERAGLPAPTGAESTR